jgi:poly-gamma-glutamate capsule biosynthesis protein CapA/YwtB (metallophosphatase superfamily)
MGDVLVATFHVTGPPSYLPRPELRAAVDTAITAGALVVAAHGTHALGPVERRGKAVIAWGLGNLLFACDCTDEVDGAVLRVSIDGDAARARILPIDAGLRGAPARPGHNPELILDLLDALGSSPLRREGPAAGF